MEGYLGRGGRVRRGGKGKERIAQQGLSHLPSFCIRSAKPRGNPSPFGRPPSPAIYFTFDRGLGGRAKKSEASADLEPLCREWKFAVLNVFRTMAGRENFYIHFFTSPWPRSLPPPSSLVSHGRLPTRAAVSYRRCKSAWMNPWFLFHFCLLIVSFAERKSWVKA